MVRARSSTCLTTSFEESGIDNGKRGPRTGWLRSRAHRPLAAAVARPARRLTCHLQLTPARTAGRSSTQRDAPLDHASGRTSPGPHHSHDGFHVPLTPLLRTRNFSRDGDLGARNALATSRTRAAVASVLVWRTHHTTRPTRESTRSLSSSSGSLRCRSSTKRAQIDLKTAERAANVSSSARAGGQGRRGSAGLPKSEKHGRALTDLGRAR